MAEMTTEREHEIENMSLREILDIIDVYLKNGQYARDLGHILSALRGPDQEMDVEYKNKSTAIIRAKALPRCCEDCQAGWMFNTDDDKVVVPSRASYHFRQHIVYAADALEIPYTREKRPDGAAYNEHE